MVLDIFQSFFSLIPGNFIDISLYYAPLVAIALTISIFIYNWRIGKNKEKESLENIKEKYIEVYENSDKIKASDFNIAKYNEYYYKRPVNTEISDSLNNGENILIIGKPKAGKTRAAHEAIKRVKGFKIIKFWEDLIKIEELPDNLFEGQKIIFIDDLNKYIGKLDFNRLIKKLNSKSKKYMIVVTCRSGEEYKHCKKEFEEYLKDFKKINLEDIDENTARDISNKFNLKFEDFDGTIGSLFLGISDMKLRYNDLPKECRVLLTVIKIFAHAGSYIITKETLEKVYSAKITKENMNTNYFFDEVVGKLKDNSFIFEVIGILTALHDTYLDIPAHKVSLNDLVWLKKILIEINDENALFNLGTVFYNVKYYDNALICFDKAIEINPDSNSTLINKGATLAELRKYDEALTCYEKSLKINPNSDEAWTNKGTALINLGKYDEALNCYNKALEINSNSDDACTNKGAVLDTLGEYEKAIACHDKSLELNSNNLNAWANKGISLINICEYEESLKCYEEALKINPNDDGALTNKGVVLTELGRYWEAHACHEKALEINPNADDAWMNKGNVLCCLGEFVEAITCYDKSLEINPNSDDTWNNKGGLLGELGEYKEALNCFTKALKINPENENIQLNIIFLLDKYNTEMKLMFDEAKATYLPMYLWE